MPRLAQGHTASFWRDNRRAPAPRVCAGTHSFLPWNLTVDTRKVSVKSKHNYIKSLAILLRKSNRKMYCVSEASREASVSWQQRKITVEYFWGEGERRGTKRSVDNKITSNPNWPTFSSPDPINLTLVNSALQSKHLKIYFGLSITRKFSCQWSAAHFFVWQPQRPERQSFWSPSYRLLTGGFSSRPSKYTSLSNSHNMLITIGYYVDLFKTSHSRNAYSLGRSSTACSNASHFQ